MCNFFNFWGAVSIQGRSMCKAKPKHFFSSAQVYAFREVVYKSRGFCAIFQRFGTASIQGRSLCNANPTEKIFLQLCIKCN